MTIKCLFRTWCYCIFTFIIISAWIYTCNLYLQLYLLDHFLSTECKIWTKIFLTFCPRRRMPLSSQQYKNQFMETVCCGMYCNWNVSNYKHNDQTEKKISCLGKVVGGIHPTRSFLLHCIFFFFLRRSQRIFLRNSDITAESTRATA